MKKVKAQNKQLVETIPGDELTSSSDCRGVISDLQLLEVEYKQELHQLRERIIPDLKERLGQAMVSSRLSGSLKEKEVLSEIEEKIHEAISKENGIASALKDINRRTIETNQVLHEARFRELPREVDDLDKELKEKVFSVWRELRRMDLEHRYSQIQGLLKSRVELIREYDRIAGILGQPIKGITRSHNFDVRLSPMIALVEDSLAKIPPPPDSRDRKVR